MDARPLPGRGGRGATATGRVTGERGRGDTSSRAQGADNT